MVCPGRSVLHGIWILLVDAVGKKRKRGKIQWGPDRAYSKSISLWMLSLTTEANMTWGTSLHIQMLLLLFSKARTRDLFGVWWQRMS